MKTSFTSLLAEKLQSLFQPVFGKVNGSTLSPQLQPIPAYREMAPANKGIPAKF